MNYINIIKTTAYFMLTAMVPVVSKAQSKSPIVIDMEKERSLWLNSTNAAGIVHDETQTFSDITIKYNNQDGDFKRPQQGKTDKNIEVASEGLLKKNKILVYGHFDYRHQDVNNTSYNASIGDPFRGMPYYVIDEYHDSKWRNQYYTLQGKVATPITSWLTAGLGGTYKASLAAKQRDPSVDTRFYTLQITPGLIFSLSGHHRLGISFDYASVKEDSRMDNVYYYLYQNYWTSYGMGVSTKDYGSEGHTTNYIGDRIGLALQYQYETEALRTLLETSYSKHVERAEQTFTAPQKMFLTNDRKTDIKATAIYRGKRIAHLLQMAFGYRDIDGIQYMSQHDNTLIQQGWIDLHHDIRSTYVTHTAMVHYGFIKSCDKNNSEYDWRVDAEMNYLAHNDEYILPQSVKNSKNIFFTLEGKKNFCVGRHLHKCLLASVNAGLRNAMEGCYHYGGTHEEYPSVRMEQADNDFLTSDAWNMGASLTYSQQIKEEEKTTVYIKAAFDYMKSQKEDFNKRSNVEVVLGVNF